MACIENVQVNAPVKIGDVIVKNAADTGVDVIATKSIAAS
jgi:CxxC motif-containing protein